MVSSNVHSDPNLPPCVCINQSDVFERKLAACRRIAVEKGLELGDFFRGLKSEDLICGARIGFAAHSAHTFRFGTNSKHKHRDTMRTHGPVSPPPRLLQSGRPRDASYAREALRQRYSEWSQNAF